jgi:hypothetical protein
MFGSKMGGQTTLVVVWPPIFDPFLANSLTLNLHFPALFLMFLGYLINTE